MRPFHFVSILITFLFLFLRDTDSRKATVCSFCVPIHKKKEGILKKGKLWGLLIQVLCFLSLESIGGMLTLVAFLLGVWGHLLFLEFNNLHTILNQCGYLSMYFPSFWYPWSHPALWLQLMSSQVVYSQCPQWGMLEQVLCVTPVVCCKLTPHTQVYSKPTLLTQT